LVEGGERALTTAGVARAANCSKESLYKWFGDRDGLLAAMITFQASQVRAEPQPSGVAGGAALRAQLIGIGANLLRVLSGDMSLALNRLAIGQARRDEAKLGGLLLEHGRRPIETRLSALLEAGREAGLIDFDDTREAYRTLYGLIVRDMHVRLLLGDALDDAAPAARAEQAIDQFLRLHGAERMTGPAPQRAGAGNERTA
jgi:AcrR family transcriptional regulator